MKRNVSCPRLLNFLGPSLFFYYLLLEKLEQTKVNRQHVPMEIPEQLFDVSFLNILTKKLQITYLPTPEVPKSGRLGIFALQECHFRQCLNTLRKSPESLSNVSNVDNSMQKPHQPSTMYCAIWLVDFWPVMLLVKIRQFDSSSLYFLIENSSDKSTKSISCFIIFFDISKIMKLMKTFWKRSREICWQTWRLPGKQGELAGMKLYLEEGNNNL